MKKTLLTILALIIAFSLPVSLVACDNGANGDISGTDSTESSSSDESSEPAGEPIAVENGLAVYMPADRPLKIAQFADLHFGTEGNAYHNDKVDRTHKYMQDIVDTQSPDLIVCSGDNIMSLGTEKLAEFVELMESYKTPWTFIYGNHDAEGVAAGFTKKDLSDYLDTCDTQYLLYNSGYIDTDGNRYGNFSISVLNSDGTKMLGAIILLDSGTYDGSINSYQSITEGQIAWYGTEIDKLGALYKGEGVMPSIVFAHIQLPEYYDAYKAALNGNGAEFIIRQDISDAYLQSVKSGGPTDKNTGFFDVLKQKQSTVAYFCGHEHLMDFQVEYQGIKLCFGPQTGFSTLFDDNDMPRETYIYNFDQNFDFTTTVCKEDGSDLGFTFSGSFDDSGEYDAEAGVYTASYKFNNGNTIVFAYNGERLTTENTTFSGDFRESSKAEWKGGFYCSDKMTLKYDGKTSCTCKFTYDPAAGTLLVETFEIETDPDAPTSMVASTVNTDAGGDAMAVWTEAGTKLKYITDETTGEGGWIGNSWRYYVVVDSQGQIAYAVLFPLSGYGGPMSTTYFTAYPDYTNNPAIVLLDGFANDWSSGGIGYNLFEIVIPEGGFAITGHGTAIITMVDMISQGTVDGYEVTDLNNQTLYNSGIRLYYDAATKTVSVKIAD